LTPFSYPYRLFPGILCLVASYSDSAGQQRFSDDLKLTAHYQIGYVVPEYDYFIYLANAPAQAFTLSLSKATTGKTDFERLYNYPEFGVSFTYATLGNDDVFGREFAIVPYYHLKIVSRKRFNFYNELGFGLGYVTRKFDFGDNYQNIAVGSHLNLHFNLKLGANYRVSKNVLVNTGVSFDHFSNANTHNPNIGINYASVFAGVGYVLGQETPKQVGELAPHRRELGYALIGSAGAKRTRGVLVSDWFYTASLSFETKWSLLRVLHLGAGADMFYDPSAQTEIESQQRTDYQPSADFTTGIHLSQEFIYSRLSLIFQEGFYLGLKDQVNHETMYHRGIVRFRVGKQAFVQFSMKTHWVVLDYPEFGFGMKWK
jgi:opacity protein-like surface antigen